jgi:hypothetical protein
MMAEVPFGILASVGKEWRCFSRFHRYDANCYLACANLNWLRRNTKFEVGRLDEGRLGQAGEPVDE